MANDNNPEKDRAANAARDKKVKAPAVEAERPFDMWLQKQLHAMYDEIAAEPLPNDLMKLIERDADKVKRSPKK